MTQGPRLPRLRLAFLGKSVCNPAGRRCLSLGAKKCHRCGAPATAKHVYWTCPKLKDHTHEDVSTTNELWEWFKDDETCIPCVWGRAIRPQPQAIGLSNNTIAGDYFACQEEVRGYTSQNFARLAIESSEFGTDGSGGPSNIPTELKTVGAGVALINFDSENEVPTECASMFANPPGQQTVSRAELYVLILGGVKHRRA